MLGDQALLMVAVHLKGAECDWGQGSVQQTGIAIIFMNFTLLAKFHLTIYDN